VAGNLKKVQQPEVEEDNDAIMSLEFTEKVQQPEVEEDNDAIMSLEFAEDKIDIDVRSKSTKKR
jgi:hypothetical protein